MDLPGYGVPTPEMIHGALQPRFRQIEQHCRDWCGRPSRQSLRPLVTALGGMAVLARLCRQPVAGKRARRALRLLRGHTGRPAEVVVQCLTMLDGWAGRSVAESHCPSGLAPLRDAALGTLRMSAAGDGALSSPVLQYLALRECLTGQRSRGRSTASACRSLLGDDPALRAMPRRFAWDMALFMESPLTGLGSAADAPDRVRGALHALYRELSVLDAAHRLRCLALPAQVIRQAQWLIMMHLRQHPGDWPTDSRAVLLRQLLVLQWWLRSDPAERTVDLSPVLRRTGCFLRGWWQAPGPGDDVAPWLDAEVRKQVGEEVQDELCVVTRELPAREGRPVSPALCTALARLHLTLHLSGHRLLAWWADSLQQSMLTRLQAGHVMTPVWRRRLLHFRTAVLGGPVRGEGSAPDAATSVDHGRAVLDAVTDEARLLTALRRSTARAIPVEPVEVKDGSPASVHEPLRQAKGTVIDQLSGGMARLPDPAAWFSTLEADGAVARQAGLLHSVERELTVLEKGARALGVPRIEALAAVLRSVYRQIGVTGGRVDPASAPDRSLLLALRRGHAGLLHRLDQAAAWQAISRPQPVIEYLYRCMEDRQSGRPRGGLSLPQRCLSINRRMQALLSAAPPASVSGDRRTLMLTLMRDQARLLGILSAPDRNRPGQRV